jgi:DNA-binding response OmpR family regulator
MNYKKNEIIILDDFKTEKKILDSEIIDNIGVYYMSDKSSYSEKSILMTLKEFEILKNLCKHSFFKIFNRKEIVCNMSNSLSRFYREKKNLLPNLIS